MDIKLPDGTVVSAIISDESLKKIVTLRWSLTPEDEPAQQKSSEDVTVFGGDLDEDSGTQEGEVVTRSSHTVISDEYGYPVFNDSRPNKSKIVLDEDGIPQL
jgi:hypothetical protein